MEELPHVARITHQQVSVPPSATRGLLRQPVHVVAFADEEGVRFHSTFLGSRALVRAAHIRVCPHVHAARLHPCSSPHMHAAAQASLNPYPCLAA